MNLLYESETFAVMHMLANASSEVTATTTSKPQLERHGFEIVDKRSGKEVYLDGSWEDTLEGYTGLAQQPVVVH